MVMVILVICLCLEQYHKQKRVRTQYLLSSLFGKRHYHGFVGLHGFKIWKKHIIKLIGAIQKSITVNVDSPDEIYKKTFIRICERAIGEIKQAKRIENINMAMIECLTRLVFELMGGIPDHWDYKVVNRLEHWKIDGHRTLVYTQTAKQKACLLVSLADKRPYSSQLPRPRELNQKLWVDFAGNANEFILWFKQNYPTVYIDVF